MSNIIMNQTTIEDFSVLERQFGVYNNMSESSILEHITFLESDSEEDRRCKLMFTRLYSGTFIIPLSREECEVVEEMWQYIEWFVSQSKEFHKFTILTAEFCGIQIDETRDLMKIIQSPWQQDSEGAKGGINPIFNSCLYSDVINEAGIAGIAVTCFPPAIPNLQGYELMRSQKAQEWIELIWENARLADSDIGEYPFPANEEVVYSTINKYGLGDYTRAGVQAADTLYGRTFTPLKPNEEPIPVHIDFGTKTALCQRGSNGLKIHVVLPTETVIVKPMLTKKQMVINIGMSVMLRSSTEPFAGIRGGIHSVPVVYSRRMSHGVFCNPQSASPVISAMGELVCESFQDMTTRSFAITWSGHSKKFYEALETDLSTCITIATQVFSIPDFIETPRDVSGEAVMPKITKAALVQFNSILESRSGFEDPLDLLQPTVEHQA